MFKNVASQKFIVFAFDATTNLPKTGDAANITAYIAKDFGAVTALTDTSATEMDATNAKGFYLFDGTQAETNADMILVSGKSSTANVVIVGAPAAIFTDPPSFTSFVAQTGDTFARLGAPAGASVSADVASVKTDTGTTIPGRIPAALTANGNLKVSLQEILTTALTEAAGGQLSAAFKKWFDVSSPVGTVNSIPNATAGAAGGLSIVGSAMSLGTDTVDAAALKTDAVTEIVTAVFARAFSAAYNSLTFDQIVKVMLAVLVAKSSGLDTGTIVYRNPADTGDVIATSGDINGNRTTAPTLTP